MCDHLLFGDQKPIPLWRPLYVKSLSVTPPALPFPLTKLGCSFLSVIVAISLGRGEGKGFAQD